MLGRREFLTTVGVGAVGIACAKNESRSAPVVEQSAAPVTTSALRVEVWHDTICPWCRIGCHNLLAVLDSWTGPAVNLVIHPFLLDPDTPPEGADLRERLAKKYGAVPDTMFDRVTQAGARYGVQFNWDKVRITPATSRSHTLIAKAPEEKKRAVLNQIHRAYFDEGRNLGDVEVLTDIASKAGMDVAAAKAAVTDDHLVAQVRKEALAASSSGINGVPHFVFGSKVLHGAQSPEALRAALEAMRG